MVVIGDVTGRGAQAAAVTAHARYTLRTAAALTGDPVVALRTLNRELLARRGAALCSVAAMAISEDPDEPVRLAVAGHPPPLLVDGDSVVEATVPAPVLGAFTDETWALEATRGRARASSWSSSPTASPRASAPSERFGEQRLRAELAGVSSPALAAQQIEGALHEFAGGTARRRRRDPRDRPGLRRRSSRPPSASASWSSGSSRPSTAATRGDRRALRRGHGLLPGRHRRGDRPHRPLRRPRRPARVPARRRPRLGRAADHARRWSSSRGGSLLVRGRVYARSRQLGIRDIPVAWIWDARRRPLHPRRGLPRPRAKPSPASPPRREAAH